MQSGHKPSLSSAQQKTSAKTSKTAVATFKQYREKDGQFYFKLVSAQGDSLLQSRAYASPQVAGQRIAQLQQQGMAALSAMASELEPLDAAAHAAVVVALEQLANAD